MKAKQFRLNPAVGVVANIARLRSHIVRVLKKPYRQKPRRARMRDAKRMGAGAAP